MRRREEHKEEEQDQTKPAILGGLEHNTSLAPHAPNHPHAQLTRIVTAYGEIPFSTLRIDLHRRARTVHRLMASLRDFRRIFFPHCTRLAEESTRYIR